MNTLTVLNTARTLLQTLSLPVHIGDTLTTDANGLLEVPDDPAQYVLHTVLGVPEHAWGTSRYGTTRVQVNASSVIEGQALAMLAAAEPVLVAGKFVPGNVTSIGRDGPYTAYAQTFERTA